MTAYSNWQWTHERQAELVARDGWMCEQHPGIEFEHQLSSGEWCAGPGMPWMIEGRENIRTALAREGIGKAFACDKCGGALRILVDELDDQP